MSVAVLAVKARCHWIVPSVFWGRPLRPAVCVQHFPFRRIDRRVVCACETSAALSAVSAEAEMMMALHVAFSLCDQCSASDCAAETHAQDVAVPQT